MKKLRKISIIFLSLIIVFSLSSTIQAFARGARGERVNDEGGLLTSSEERELASKIEQYQMDSGLDYAIYYNYNGVAQSGMMSFSDSYYDDNGFGLDNGQSGSAIIIDMQSRQMYITTKGIAIWYLDDGDIEYIVSQVRKKLQDEDYYGAANEYLECVHTLAMKFVENQQDGVSYWNNGGYTDYREFYYDYVVNHSDIDYSLKKEKHLLESPVTCALLSAVLSAIIVLVMAFSSKPKMIVSGRDYINDNTINMRRSYDNYRKTTVVKHKIEKSSGGGGGGSFHSSGGGSHGGGGGGF